MTKAPVTHLRVGTHRDFPPFCRVADGHASGLVVDRFRAALSGSAVAIEWQGLDLPDMIPALERDAVDLLCGIGASDERARRLDISEPIVVTGGAGFGRAAETGIDLEAGPPAWAAMGLRIVSPAAGPLLAPLRAVAGLHVRDGVDYATSLAMLLRGEADVAALNFHVGREIAERDHPGRVRLPARPYLDVPLVAAAPKGRHGDVLDAINDGLRKPPAD